MTARLPFRSFFVLLAVLLTLPGQAQPLIEEVPAQAALYVGWRGAADMGPDYEGSNMQGVIEQTGLLKALPQLVEAMQAFGEQMGPEEAELVGMGGTLWSSMWTNGGAMYMLPPEEGGPPVPRLAILWNKGADEAKVREALSTFVELINDAEQVPAFMGTAGNAVYLSIGFDAGADAPQFESLKATQRFSTAAKQVQGDGALVIYIDVQEWIGQVDNFAKMMKEQAEQFDEQDPFAELWPTLRDVSGLSGVNRLMLTAGIKDKNWHTRMFIDAPAPRTGILSLIDNKPIEPSNLSHVPKTATYLQVFTMDPARVLDVTRDMLGAVDPNMVEQLDRGIKAGSEEVGFDLERELINGMGPVWSVYIDPMIAGNGFSSLVMVNELRDADSVEQALIKLTASANEAMADALDEAPVPFNIRLLTREVKGTRITHLGIPYVAPSYMVHDGRLYVSLFPQALEMAIEQSGKEADSIVANEAFTKTIGQFGVDQFTGLSFTDLPETAPDGYGINLMIMQTIAGFGEMMGGKASPLRMPPIGKVMPFIEPSGAVSWVDDNGLHMHSIEPFPGSALLGPAKGMESMMAVSGPLAVGILLPALGSAREAAREAQGLANVRQIAMASHAYAADNDGQFPADIVQLTDYVWGADVWVAGNSQRAEAPPFNFDDWDEARQQKFIRENSSYVLVPLQGFDQIKNPSETIMLFQRPDDAPGLDRVAVAWADGHASVEGDLEAFAEQIKKQTGKTIDELIERQEAFGQ